MKRVRFAPSPTGSLHVGNALSAVANRALGDWMLLRIDDTDPARNLPGGQEEILRDLDWLGIEWEEGPVHASERAARHREAAAELPQRFGGVMLWRDDGSPTYHLASVVDDVDFGITHVLRGNDHRPNEALHRRLFEALGAKPPEILHHGLILGGDGPKHDVRYDLPRIRRLAVDVIAALSDAELAARVGAPVEVVPALRGARDLNEAREYAEAIAAPPAPVPTKAPETLERFKELLERSNGAVDARAVIRELKAVGGDLHALRLALTGSDRGPELWTVIAALPRDEALRRVDAAL